MKFAYARVSTRKTPTGELITHILLAFAEFERDMIIERTQAGKEIVRAFYFYSFSFRSCFTR